MWALVPLKLLANAKQRLADKLTPQQRQGLVLAMAQDVLGALQRSNQIERIVLISRNAEATSLAQPFAAEVFAEQEGADLPQALREGVAHALQNGASGVCIIPADAPRVTTADIDLLIAQHQVCTVVPDHSCVGTNALVLSPPNILDPIFDGSSFVPHLCAAVSARLPVRVFASASLGLDIDTPSDLVTLKASAGASASKAFLKALAGTS
ncbi:MAG: 2-phospho-L-lactate guanylyltransferase [Pseudomonadales bacterium]